MNFISAHPAFNDTIDSLKYEFCNDSSNAVIVCGAYELSKTEPYSKYKGQYEKLIVFNQEPLLAKQHTFITESYYAWLKLADEVWDYDENNLKILRTIRPDAKLHILHPYKVWPQTYTKDIDILFYGAMNTHREKLLTHLSSKYNVCILTNEYDELDSYILRSKVLLNIHYYYETALQEQARIIRWIGSPSRIVSEMSLINYLNIEQHPYHELFNLEVV